MNAAATRGLERQPPGPRRAWAGRLGPGVAAEANPCPPVMRVLRKYGYSPGPTISLLDAGPRSFSGPARPFISAPRAAIRALEIFNQRRIEGNQRCTSGELRIWKFPDHSTCARKFPSGEPEKWPWRPRGGRFTPRVPRSEPARTVYQRGTRNGSKTGVGRNACHTGTHEFDPGTGMRPPACSCGSPIPCVRDIPQYSD